MAETDDPTADEGLINGAIRSVSWDADADANGAADEANGADGAANGVANGADGAANGVANGADGAANGAADAANGAADEFFEDDFEIEYPANEGAPPPSAARRGAVASAFLGAGLALEQVIYGEKRSIPAVVQEADDPLDDGDFDLHLDPDNPADSWARLRTKDQQPAETVGSDASE